MDKRLSEPVGRSRAHLRAYERLAKLCSELARNRYPTKSELAVALEVNVRTIQRDLQFLRERLEAPIVFDPERNGFGLTDSKWCMPPITLSEDELDFFLAAERLIRRLGAGVQADLAREALRGMTAQLPKGAAADFGVLVDTVQLAPEPVLHASAETLGKLQMATAHRQTLHIHYFSQHRSTSTIRDVNVLKVVEDKGEWYAVAWDHKSGEIRDFHAGRIRAIYETERTFEPPEGWDPDAHVRSGFGMFRGGEDVSVTVEFDAYQAAYARERSYHPTQTIEELGEDGRLRVSFTATTASLEQVARWVLGFGEHARAVGPDSLVRLVQEQLTKTLSLYSEGVADE